MVKWFVFLESGRPHESICSVWEYGENVESPYRTEEMYTENGVHFQTARSGIYSLTYYEKTLKKANDPEFLERLHQSNQF